MYSRRLSLLLSLVFSALAIYGQVEFLEQTSEILTNPAKGGVAVVITDVDGDGFDDIVSTDRATTIVANLYQGKGRPYQFETLAEGFSAVWSMVAADLDEDGDSEIIVGDVGGIYFLNKNATGTFEKTVIIDQNWLPQTMNLVDIDQDEHLDLFICNDDGANVILKNDGNGQFALLNIIDFNTIPESDNSGNYGSIWTDIDSDGDPDLYIAKCRAGVTELTDPRRINVLHINNGDGTFSEQALEYNVADPYQSWSVDAGDVDNDGDMDLFVTNHDGPHRLFINEGTTFVEYPYSDIPVSTLAYQGVFHDIDNNGWLDIIISDGVENAVFFNDRLQFTRSAYQVAGVKPNSAMIVDIYNDGFADLMGQYGGQSIVHQDFISLSDKIWVSQRNSNNYITFKLEGALDAGAKVFVKSDLGTQMREVHYGSSYGQQSSTDLHFGLESDSTLMEVIVIWPDGEEQIIEPSQLLPNSHYTIHRSGCVSRREQIIPADGGILCEGRNLSLSSELGNTVEWLSNVADDTIVIDSFTSYLYQYIDADGCLHNSDYFVPTTDSSVYSNLLDVVSEQVICNGSSIRLTAEKGDSYVWSTAEESQNIEVVTSGSYAVAVTSVCGNVYQSDTVEVQVIEPEPPTIEDVTVNLGGTAILQSDVIETYWYGDSTSAEPILISDRFTIDEVFDPTKLYASTVSEAYSYEGNVGILDTTISQGYSANSINSGLRFIVHDPILLKSLQVSTDVVGERKLVVLTDGAEVFSKSYFLSLGKNNLALDLPLQPGAYVITTDRETNIANLGHNGPRFSRVQSEEDVTYPYAIDSYMDIIESLNGATRYYYFFDWEVEYGYHRCESIRVPVNISVNPLAITKNTEPKISIFPIPAKDHVTVESDITMEKIVIRDVTGAEALIHESEGHDAITLNISSLDSGIYFIQVVTIERSRYIDTFIVIK